MTGEPAAARRQPSAAVSGSSGAGPAPSLPVRFGADGLAPVVAQDAATGQVLMVAFMNAEALARTRRTGRVHYWSRSRGRLWRKGEASGHEQVVEAILVNCEHNSLLLKVRQLGAVCHDGYPTCYYRRLEPDGSLTIVEELAFDPAAVYAPDAPPAAQGQPAAAGDARPLATAARLLYGALGYLRENDLTTVSRTSVRLRRQTDTVSPRITQELRELAGVLDGTHRHGGLRDDVLLEGTQVLYWVLLAAVRGAVPWDRLRSDRALASGEADLDPATAARLLRAEAARWETGAGAAAALGARCHATLALVAQAASVADLGGLDLVEADLAEMRSRPYLDPYFARAEGEPPS